MNKPWVKSAPQYLIDGYIECRFGNNARPIFKRLLCDERMKHAWIELARNAMSDKQWLDVWRSIASAKAQSNKTKLRLSRSDTRDKYLLLKKKFCDLADAIENGLLDVPAYDVFPQDALDILGLPKLKAQNGPQRATLASGILSCWPTTPELLRGLESLASNLAISAMQDARADDRSGPTIKARVFVSHLGERFNYMFGRKLLGTIASITDVVFNSEAIPINPFTKTFVQSVLRDIGKAGT